ncbi:tail fiber protein [Roseibium sp. TrichSKD4]|uniref:host specificity factor TipJ family phage tail protein n=1 Tax=Roseibium sp. TrichSKD4 TaxID=744980 RepID=UPI0001E56B94|nr:fibronectin type III domain-containing protein [Roseibium sp. TrichSKD4]EFO32625.1 tail fiber protein [Roseibium sp. TrichSKD4]
MNQITKGTAASEVLGPEARIDVFFRPSPFRQGRLAVCVPVGVSVFEIVDACRAATKTGHDSPLSVRIGGEPVPRRFWGRVRVRPGVSVEVVRVPGKGAVRKIIGAVVAIVALIVAPYIAAPLIGALGLAGVAATAVTGAIAAGLTLVGSMAVNALFPVTGRKELSKASQSADQTTPLYSIGGAQNTARQFEAIPVIFGTHRISPPYAAAAYTEIVGDEQYLRMLFCAGYGPLAISDIRIGETPLSAFEGVSHEVIEDHTQSSPTLYTQPVYEEQGSMELDGPSGWVQRTTADDVTEISVDVSWPSGVLRYRKSDGNRVSYSVTVAVQYAVAGSQNWIDAGAISVSASSSQALRRSRAWSVASGKYDVRLRKTSADYSGADTVQETTYWTALRGRRPVSVVNFERPLTLIALRIKASNELNGVVNTLNCIASTKMKAFDGAVWQDGQISRNPADHFRHVLQGVANERGVGDGQIDIAGLERWWAYCNTKGFTFDYVAGSRLSVPAMLETIAASGRASLSRLDGKWGVVWDVPDSPIVQHFSPRNSSDFSSARVFADLPHAFRVGFINRDGGYTNDERIVYDDGYSKTNAIKFEGIEFQGVTSPDLVWKHARYHIAQTRLRREGYELSTDWENLVCTRGDRVRVNHDVIKVGVGSARVKLVEEEQQVIHLDSSPAFVDGKTYAIRFRLADGQSLLRQVQGISDDGMRLTLSGSGGLPHIGDLALVGEAGVESLVLRVKSVRPGKDLTARLELVDDAPEIANADQGAIPAFVTNIPGPIDPRAFPPRNVSVSERVDSLVNATSQFDVTWQPPAEGAVTGYIIRYRLQGESDWLHVSSRDPLVTIRDLAAGSYDIGVRAVFDGSQMSAWETISASASLFQTPPASVENLRGDVNGERMTLSWSPVNSEVVRGYEIRFSPGTENISWSSAGVVAENVNSEVFQVAARTGTYLVRAVSYSNLWSRNDAVLVNTVSQINANNVVEEIVDEGVFSGGKHNVTQVGDGLRLELTGDLYSLEDVYAASDIYAIGDFEETGYYMLSDIVDLGQVLTSRVSAEVVAHGLRPLADFYAIGNLYDGRDIYDAVSEALWRAWAEVSITSGDPADPASWGDWTPIAAADLTARALRFRCRMETRQADVTPIVTRFSALVDMPDRLETGSDIHVPVGGTAITFAKPFQKLKGVGVLMQDMASGDRYKVAPKSETGFTVQFFNSEDESVARSFDFVASGYGEVI